jgi:hypothetical protein
MYTSLSRTLIVLAASASLGCSTVSIKAVGRIEVQRSEQLPEQAELTAYTEESVSGVAALCALTFLFYGGGCWAYLAYPTDSERRAFEKKISDLVEQSASCLKVSFIRAERFGWVETGDRLEVVSKKGKTFSADNLQDLCREGPLLVATPTESLPRSAASYQTNASVNCDEDGCRSFKLTVTNKTNGPIAIDWSRTQFIQGTQTRGTFMFEGVRYVDRNAPLAPAIVLPMSTYEQVIFPSILIDNPSAETGWKHLPFSPGDVGIALTLDLPEGKAFETISFRLAPPEQSATDSKPK